MVDEMQVYQAVRIRDDEARVNVTWKGQNADLPDPVNYDASEADVKRWITEAVHNGVPGIEADPRADFTDFVVDRYPPNEQRPYNLIQIRPKTPFGGLGDLWTMSSTVQELEAVLAALRTEDPHRWKKQVIDRAYDELLRARRRVTA